MSLFDHIVETKIQDAMEEGAFDNLRGQGKPIVWPEDLDGPSSLAHHLLASQGFTLPWIEENRDIETTLKAARLTLARAWAWRFTQPGEWAETRWSGALDTFRRQVADLNRRTRNYNLSVPAASLQRLSVDAEQEIRRLTQDAPAVT